MADFMDQVQYRAEREEIAREELRRKRQTTSRKRWACITEAECALGETRARALIDNAESHRADWIVTARRLEGTNVWTLDSCKGISAAEGFEKFQRALDRLALATTS